MLRRLFQLSCLRKRQQAIIEAEEEDLIPAAQRSNLPEAATTILIIQKSHKKEQTARKSNTSPKKTTKTLRPHVRRHASAPHSKGKGSSYPLPTVTEEEEQAFSYQLSQLEDPPEWDLNAGIGASEYETSAITPPSVITTARASSPSKLDKVTENYQKNRDKLVAKVHVLLDHNKKDIVPANRDNNRPAMIKSKSAPNLSTIGGKGHAGSLTLTVSNQHHHNSPAGRRSPPTKPSSSSSTSTSSSSTATPSHHNPPSWRIPPKSFFQVPHVRDPIIPQGIPSPARPSSYFEPKHHKYSVMARTMWKDGEVRFEDQWGRKLIPIGRQDSFAFELWPVPEITEEAEEKE